MLCAVSLGFCRALGLIALASRLRAGLPLFVCKHDFFDNAAFERIRQVGQEPDSVHNSQEDHDYSALSPSFLSCADTFQSVDACARRPDWRLGGPPPMGMAAMQVGPMPMHTQMQGSPRMPGMASGSFHQSMSMQQPGVDPGRVVKRRSTDEDYRPHRCKL